ncbi:DNA polymerase III subunit gamma/tau [Akkermansia sp.]|uniref:DNA polymerase III subunit gamma/tau n=1 Tax=Akkermansia sp. TaxID=1872421 RepID=UPI0025C1F7A9|nr:DNA polymerase III subunit gamma/tau [Akkermansia sp.]MCD8063964.1 DNA polymerase III subunit gamma/tau [Akkermansia sp.]
MSYQVFARKYRPLTFDDVLGQDHVVQTLKNAIEHNRLAHAYLFVGPRGTGKTSTARIFAKALNCSGGPSVDFDPHEDICEEIAEGRSLDVLEIDGASNRGIDHIRDLRDNVRFAPSRGNFRIVYIDEVHMLTKESFNALLKTLEEPPPHVKFIFATTEPHKLLPTLLSRCQRFDLRPIPSEIIAEHLLHIASAEGVSLSREAAFAVAKVADGGMRDAQSMLDQLVSFCGDHIEEQQVLHIFGITSRETVAHALALILNKELPSLLHLLHEQAEAGRDMGQFLSEIISAVREILVSKVDPEASFDSLPESSKEELSELVKRTQTDKILRLVEVLAETEDKMRWSTNKRLHLEMGLIKAVHALAEASISDIIMALEGAPLATSVPSFSPAPRQEQGIPAPAAPAPAPEPPANAQPPVPAENPEPAPEEHLMDPVPDFSPGKPFPAPAVQASGSASAQPAPAPAEEPEPQPTAPAPEPEPPATAAKVPSPAIPQEEPSCSAPEPRPESISDTPEEPQRPSSAISDAPVAPPDSPEPTFMDPEENLPPERRTSSFFDNLFDTASAPSRTPAPMVKEEPEALAPQSGRTITEEDWKAALERAAANFPLQADFLANSVFSGHDGAFVAISFHPSDHQGMDSLGSGPLRAALEADLSQRGGVPVTISIRQDSSVPEPVQEELAPLPAPPPAASAPAPKPQTPREKPAAAVQEPAREENEDNSYYTDPLIDAAMEIFRARIISQ